MLTDGQFKECVAQKKIIVEPYDEHNARSGKYDVHLGRYLLVPEPISVPLDPNSLEIEPRYSKIDLQAKPFILQPGQFVLGQTHELIGLDGDIGMFIDGPTTLARLGLSIHQTSTFIPPGQDPHIITLEVYNAGIWQVQLSFNMRIGKLLAFQYDTLNVIQARQFNLYNGQQETRGADFRANIPRDN